MVCAMPSGHPGPVVQVVATAELSEALADALAAMLPDQAAVIELRALKLQIDIALLADARKAVRS